MHALAGERSTAEKLACETFVDFLYDNAEHLRVANLRELQQLWLEPAKITPLPPPRRPAPAESPVHLENITGLLQRASRITRSLGIFMQIDDLARLSAAFNHPDCRRRLIAEIDAVRQQPTLRAGIPTREGRVQAITAGLTALGAAFRPSRPGSSGPDSTVRQVRDLVETAQAAGMLPELKLLVDKITSRPSAVD